MFFVAVSAAWPSDAITVIVADTTLSGAYQVTVAPDGLDSPPTLHVQAYMSVSLSGSDALHVKDALLPASTESGPETLVMVGGRFAAWVTTTSL
jgi:hypothetical protein